MSLIRKRYFNPEEEDEDHSNSSAAVAGGTKIQWSAQKAIDRFELIEMSIFISIDMCLLIKLQFQMTIKFKW